MNWKLKTWREFIKTNFHVQDISYDVYCKSKRSSPKC